MNVHVSHGLAIFFKSELESGRLTHLVGHFRQLSIKVRQSVALAHVVAGIWRRVANLGHFTKGSRPKHRLDVRCFWLNFKHVLAFVSAI
jgi:hypothetical protein